MKVNNASDLTSGHFYTTLGIPLQKTKLKQVDRNSTFLIDHKFIAAAAC